MNFLSKRLSIIKDLVPKGIVADIGADHGKLIISLVEDGKADYGYAIENKKGPFDTLQRAISSSSVSSRITPMFSDGITDLPSDVNVIVLAGMGGATIIDILYSHREKLKNVEYIVVDAHTSIGEIRRAIVPLGYQIDEEQILLEDGTYYEIIRFKKGEITSYSDTEYDFGPILVKNKSDDFIQKWSFRIKEIDTLLANPVIPDERKQQLTLEKERIKKVL